MFYVIEDGSFTIYSERDGAELARVGKGSCFGELALLRQARNAPACGPAMHPPQVWRRMDMHLPHVAAIS